jgi:hypothetical protein
MLEWSFHSLGLCQKKQNVKHSYNKHIFNSRILQSLTVMPQILISVCLLNLTLGNYWVELGFINNMQETPIVT